MTKNSLDSLMAEASALRSSLADKKQQASALEGLLVSNSSSSSADSDSTYHSLLTLEVLPQLLALTSDSKLAKNAQKVLRSAVETCSQNPVLAGVWVPALIDMVESPPQGKWKGKAAALELLQQGGGGEGGGGLLTSLSTRVRELHMARFVKVLVSCSKEVRAEIKTISAQLLEQVGKLVSCEEIKKIAEKLVGCLKNFGNMKLASETLYLIANTTFMSYVDAASFALLFPIVERAMKERDFTAKKNGLMIVGAAVGLIQTTSTLEPYLPALLPLLQDLALDPTFEIRREATKSIASLSKSLPWLLEKEILAWTFKHLQATAATNSTQAKSEDHDSGNSRTGAAATIAEVLNHTTDTTLLDRVLDLVLKPRALGETGNRATAEKRAGAFEALESLCKTDVFEKQACGKCIRWVLQGLRDDSGIVQEAALAAGKAILLNFGAPNADILVHPLADAVLSFEGTVRASGPSAKALAITLFRELVERVSEARTYGTDMWSMETCSLRTRTAFLVLLQVSRTDEEAELRRQSNKTLSEQCSSLPKAKKETEAALLGALQTMLQAEGTEGATLRRKAAAERCVADLKEKNELTVEKLAEYSPADVLEQENWEEISKLNEVETKALAEFGDISAGKSLHVSLAGAPEEEEEEEEEETCFKDLAGLALAAAGLTTTETTTEKVKDSSKAACLPSRLLVSCVQESLTSTQAYQKIQKLNLDGLLQACGGEDTFTEGVLQEKVYKHYRPKELKQLENPDEILCHVEDLMLMYGGGHLLLKDTTFELRKGRRYGVVGRNGTGKTTLMNLLALGGVPRVPKEMTCTHVKPEVLDLHMTTKCLTFMELENPGKSQEVLEETLRKVQFPESLWKVTVGELSGGWRMRLLIAGAMMKKSDVLLLDEPTNHLDSKAVTWLSDYLVGLVDSAIMVISHDPGFLNRVCTDIINYNKGKLVYYKGNFDAFTEKLGINAADAEALLAGQVAVSENGVERGGDEKTAAGLDDGGDSTPRSDGVASESTVAPVGGLKSRTNSASSNNLAAKGGPLMEEGEETPVGNASPSGPAAAAPDRKAKIVFPIAGKVKGLNSLAKPVLEINDLTYAYTQENGDVIQGVSGKITMNSRIGIKGVNGAGKTTFLNLICGEVHPNASACPQKGTVARHRNCRLAYMAQHHMHHMKDYMSTSPYIYIQKRYQNGYDGALQERLLEPANEEEKEERAKRAKKYGKYGCALKTLTGRQMRGKDLYYEASWQGLDDTSKNSWLSLDDLKNLGCESFALAYDDRAAAIEGGIADRPLSQREIVKHLEQFGITEELALNRNIGMFSAGQKSKVSLAAAFWIKPHVVALDEPTNYIDMETLDALTVALQRFKGGVVCISHCAEFVEKVCNEMWYMEGGQLTVSKTGGGK